ncbi:MAG: VWA domain-containing protein [Planctomycetes bacterium]|nr:VWA domain-containing protein [Planctomycetota bacterium]
MTPLLALLQAPVEAGAKSAAEGRLTLFGHAWADPIFGLLLLLVPLALAWGRLRYGRPRARVSVVPAGAPPATLRQLTAWLPLPLRAAALVCVVLALARPLLSDVATSSQTEGVDLALLVDRSSSMNHADLEQGRTRLEVVKDVVRDFATRRMTDREGACDYVGLISFARYPQELCPFTLDVDAVTGFLDGIQLADDRNEDGTGIGIALAKAVAVLRESEAKSKVVVLLTDGENNLDLISPREAAELAAEEGIRVYTVFAGRYVMDAFGRLREADLEIDTSDLEYVAETTGGRFFRARDRRALEEAYAEIEALERTPREEERFVEFYDRYPSWLTWALLCYSASWLLACTVSRRVP